MFATLYRWFSNFIVVVLLPIMFFIGIIFSIKILVLLISNPDIQSIVIILGLIIGLILVAGSISCWKYTCEFLSNISISHFFLTGNAKGLLYLLELDPLNLDNQRNQWVIHHNEPNKFTIRHNKAGVIYSYDGDSTTLKYHSVQIPLSLFDEIYLRDHITSFKETNTKSFYVNMKNWKNDSVIMKLKS